MSRKIFNHAFYAFDDIKMVSMHDKRYYESPNGVLLESVTTRLGQAMDKSGLEAWKKRVGEEEAAKISTQAGIRGTAVHDLAEKYLLNDPHYTRGAMPINVHTFSAIRKILDERIGTIYALEAPLYSETLRTAGRTDCIAEFDGITSIVDFKTSKRPKKEEHILSYFLQATCYSLMAEELTDLVIPQIAIIIMVDHDDPQVFVKNKSDYVDRVREIFN